MKSRIVLVTGATSGIGRHTALDLARAGHRVFATGRRVDALESLRQQAEKEGLSIDTLALDVTKPSSIEQARVAIEQATNGYGVDAVINNAGYGLVGPVESIGDEALRAQYETNVFGLLGVTRAFLPAMRQRGSGRIVNVSSIGGRITFPMMGVYNSTKYAVESLSDALRVELRPFGVGVSLIEPGAIRTEFADVAMSTVAHDPSSPYAGATADADAMRKKFEATMVGPEYVTRAIRKAVESRRPRARYVTPRSAGVAIWLFKLLPTSWSDALLGQMSGLTRQKLVGDGSAKLSLAS
ncbi:MAG: SDR family oxidoreductase [Polyangiaceae bacterium]|nr:SDR family oxidoreductase [Polyangiaceae bacterium]